MFIGHRWDFSVEGSLNVETFSFSPSSLLPQIGVDFLHPQLDNRPFPPSCEQEQKKCDWRLEVAKYFVLYEFVHTSLNLISLCLLTAVECRKGLLSLIDK